MNALTLIEKTLKITSMPMVKAMANLFCLNKERIKKKDVVETICSDINLHFKDSPIKRKLVAEECRIMQKYYFKEQIKKLSLRKRNLKILNDYREKLRLLDSLDSSDEIIDFLSRYYINDMAADFDPAFLIVFKVIAKLLFKNMHSSLRLTEESKEPVEKVKRLQGKYPLFFMPNHISNADHIPLCIALNKAGIFHPIIVAGANLYRGVSRKILPKANCYKLQRDYIHGSVKWLSNPLYNMVFKKYNYYLWSHNEPFLFYIEGTRSRDGKILPPKYGFLKEIVNFVGEFKTKAYFVPISLSYTVVPEDLELVQSLRGKNISQKDLLTQNLELDKIYGSVKDSSIYINISEPVEISYENIPNVTELGKKLLGIISENIVVTPTYHLAVALKNLSEEQFSLSEVREVFSEKFFTAEKSDYKLLLSVDEILEAGIDVFVKKNAIQNIGDETFKIVNKDLIVQYANRVAHFYE